MYDAIAIGSATRDVFVRSGALETNPSEGLLSSVDACFPLGAKIDIDELVIETGGGATNAAVTFSRLGMASASLTAIGDDANGRDIVVALKNEKVDTDVIQVVPKQQTAFGLVMLAGSGERTVFVYRGASEAIDADAVPWDKLKAKWFYVTSLGGRIDFLSRLFSHAAKHKIRVAWNPGNKEIRYGLEDLGGLIKQVDVFNLNVEEAMSLVVTTNRDLVELFEAIRRLPKTAAVLTDGPNGAYAADKKHIWHAPAMDVKRINVTGAGDAFGSGFVAGLMKSDSLASALATGIWNSSGVIQKMGAKLGLMRKYPTAEQLKKIGVRQWR